MEPWLRAAGHSVGCTRLYAGEKLPSTDAFDLLIVMGGPMGANDEAELPWMAAEKALIRQAIDEQKRVLGVCLGAQLIAAVLGARVFKNAHREIGWFEIERCGDAAKHPLGRIVPESAEVFHWHGDTFDLPAEAVRLASSKACLNQAFALGQHVLALQFHLETTRDSASKLIEHCSNELTPSPYVQTAEQMLEQPERFDRINAVMAEVLRAMCL
jgi:GMP synthase-like glutamine amidotransferase